MITPDKLYSDIFTSPIVGFSHGFIIPIEISSPEKQKFE